MFTVEDRKAVLREAFSKDSEDSEGLQTSELGFWREPLVKRCEDAKECLRLLDIWSLILGLQGPLSRPPEPSFAKKWHR